MSRELVIDIEWLESQHGPPELRHTTGWLNIAAGDKGATRNEDRWAQTVRPRVLVSGYPLALWLVGSWWRLRWETAPSGSPAISWRLAHEMPAAGHGYVWPFMTFVSDRETIDVQCRATDADPWAPVVYLSSFRKRVSAPEFEAAVGNFANLILARLDALGSVNSELHDLWSELAVERESLDISRWRSLEARLGFDADEGSEDLLSTFQDLGLTAGPGAVEEIASACAGDEPATKVEQIQQLAGRPGPTGSIDLRLLPSLGPSSSLVDTPRPWNRGHELARAARAILSLDVTPISDTDLGGILGLRTEELVGGDIASPSSPLSLAVRTEADNNLRFVFRKARKDARRFEAARFLGDFLMASPDDRWLPLTDTKTARQKMQRAFAAEFLMPIEELVGFMGNDFSNERMESAAEEFQVSSLAVRSHLANNNHIPAF